MTTWFITGASRGFGREVANEALSRGDQVVATARSVDHLSHLAERFGELVLPIALDVSDVQQVTSAVATGTDFHAAPEWPTPRSATTAGRTPQHSSPNRATTPCDKAPPASWAATARPDAPAFHRLLTDEIKTRLQARLSRDSR